MDAAARAAGAEKPGVKVTHDDLGEMLAEVDCEVVAVGDYYAKRGSVLIQALKAGKHVIGDKPLCTSLAELDEIEALAREKKLKVGCMFPMRHGAPAIGLRELVRAGTLGEIHAISFGGQHPLLQGSRPGWYFEPGKHGGTINDIAIHAFDAIPWITGRRFATINAARCWNAFVPEHPHFKDGGQLMLTLDNGGGVLGDVSYFSPDSLGYGLPFYWRLTLFGRRGIAESSTGCKAISVALDGEPEMGSRPLPPANRGGYLRSFLRDIAGATSADEADTATVLRAAWVSLKVQQAADRGETEVEL